MLWHTSRMFVESIVVGAAVWDHREQISGAFASLRFLLQHGLVRVVVIGAGGTGKSTLLQKMSGSQPPHAYEISPVVEHGSVKGVPFGKMKVFPGQPRRRELHLSELNDALTKGPTILIHQVAYGYHNLDTESFTQHKHYAAGDDAALFMAKHQPDCLNEELRVLREAEPLIAGAAKDKVVRMITLVSKQDLWWSQRDAARRHYTDPNAPYSQAIAAIQSVRGRHFDHACLSVSLQQLNLRTQNNEVLATTAAGYDDGVQEANLAVFASHFIAICRNA